MYRLGATFFLTLVFAPSLVAQTATLTRTPDGRVVVTNGPSSAPASASQPVAAPARPSKGEVAPLASPPWSLKDGGADTATIQLQIPPYLSLARWGDRNYSYVAVRHQPSSGSGGFPYHVHSLATVEGSLFVNAAGDSSAEASGLTATKEVLRFYRGSDRSKWPAPMIVQEGLRWMTHGCELTVTGDATTRHYVVRIPPGVDPSGVSFGFGDSMEKRDDGSFVLHDSYSGARVVQPAPRAYQVSGGAMENVQSKWAPSCGSCLIFGSFDHSRDLFVEFDLARLAEPEKPGVRIPALLSVRDVIATDPDGSIYVAAIGSSNGLPADSMSSSNELVAVEKFSREGDRIYTTLLSGVRNAPLAIAPDGKGNVFVSGLAAADFPATTARCTTPDCYGLFRTKLDATGQVVESLIDPSLIDIHAIALDSNGLVYLLSNPAGFEKLPDFRRGFYTDQKTTDFVAKIDFARNEGSRILYSSLLGPFGGAGAVAPADDGTFYIGGIIVPDALEKPFLAAGGMHKFYGGSSDGFVARIDPRQKGLSSLKAWSFIGGSGDSIFGNDAVLSIAISGQSVFVGGYTVPNNFPFSQGAWISDWKQGSKAGFVASFDRDIQNLRWATFVNRRGDTLVRAVAVDERGNVVAVGDSTGLPLPSVHAPSEPLRVESEYDRPIGHLFATKLNTNGSAAVWALTLGTGEFEDGARGGSLAITPTGDALVVARQALASFSHPPTGSVALEPQVSWIRLADCSLCGAAPAIQTVRRIAATTFGINGSNFDRGAKVWAGSRLLQDVEYVSASLLKVNSPEPGNPEFTVVNPDGQSSTAPFLANSVASSTTAVRKTKNGAMIYALALGLVLAAAVLVGVTRRRRPRRVAPYPKRK